MFEKNFPFSSLCMVTDINEKGIRILKRLADLEDDKFQAQFSFPAPTIKNLFNKGCDLPVGFLSVFNWRVEPHRNKEGSFWIESELCQGKNPIGVIRLLNCNGKNDLRNKLLSGIKFEFSTEVVLIAYRFNNNYRGVLCTRDDFEEFDDKKKLSAVSPLR